MRLEKVEPTITTIYWAWSLLIPKLPGRFFAQSDS